MTPDSPSFESKTVLTPEAMVKLLFLLRGGSFTAAHDVEGIENLFTAMQFPTGPEGKQAKLEAADRGIVIVQRGIAAVRDDARVLLATRNEPHLVTRGGSILTSGSPTLPPLDVFSKKVAMDPPPPPEAFHRIGFALSAPEQTGGIHYFFDIHKLRVGTQSRIASLTRDAVTFVSFEDAQAALEGKPLELSLLRELAV